MSINFVVTTEDYENSTKHIKDIKTKERIKKQIEKIINHPKTGKPLTHDLKGERSIRIKPFRLIYSIEGDKLILMKFEHRKEVYD